MVVGACLRRKKPVKHAKKRIILLSPVCDAALMLKKIFNLNNRRIFSLLYARVCVGNPNLRRVVCSMSIQLAFIVIS